MPSLSLLPAQHARAPQPPSRPGLGHVFIPPSSMKPYLFFSPVTWRHHMLSAARACGGCQGKRLLLLLSLVPPTGCAVSALSDQVAYLTWGRRTRSNCAMIAVPRSPGEGPHMTSPRVAMHSRWTSARELAVAIITSLHFASSCSSTILAQGKDRWGPLAPGSRTARCSCHIWTNKCHSTRRPVCVC